MQGSKRSEWVHLAQAEQGGCWVSILKVIQELPGHSHRPEKTALPCSCPVLSRRLAEMTSWGPSLTRLFYEYHTKYKRGYSFVSLLHPKAYHKFIQEVWPWTSMNNNYFVQLALSWNGTNCNLCFNPPNVTKNEKQNTIILFKHLNACGHLRSCFEFTYLFWPTLLVRNTQKSIQAAALRPTVVKITASR